MNSALSDVKLGHDSFYSDPVQNCIS